jgi:hypothetical protein
MSSINIHYVVTVEVTADAGHSGDFYQQASGCILSLVK